MTCHELNDPFLSGMDSLAAYHTSAKFPAPHYHPTHHRAARPSRRAPLPHLAIDPPDSDIRASRLSHHQQHAHHHHHHAVHHHGPAVQQQPQHQPQHHHHHTPASHQALHQVASHHAPAPHHAHHTHQQPHHAHHLQFAGSAKPHRRYSEHALTTQPPVNLTPTTPYVNITPIFVATFTKDSFIHVCSDYLDTLTRRFADLVALPTHNEPESVFFSIAKPDIPTIEYVRRLVNYTQCSPSAFVVMLIYLDRIAAANPRLVVTPFNLHRLLLTALTLACKVLDDRCFANAHYAKVGGIRTAREMNRLELQFLHYVDFRLHVTPEHYAKFERMLDNPRGPHSPRSIQHTALDLSASGSPVSAAASSAAASAASLSPSSQQHPSSVAPPVAVLYANSPPRPSPRMRSVHDLMSTASSSATAASLQSQTPALSSSNMTGASALTTSTITSSLASASSSLSSRPSVSFDMATPTPTTVDPRHAPPAPGSKPAHLSFARTDDFYLHHQHTHHHAAPHLHASHQPTLAQTRPTQSQPLPHVYATLNKRGRRTSASYSADGLAPPAPGPYGSSSWYSARA